MPAKLNILVKIKNYMTRPFFKAVGCQAKFRVDRGGKRIE